LFRRPSLYAVFLSAISRICDFAYMRFRVYAISRKCDIAYMRFRVYAISRICDFAYMQLKNDLFSATYLLLYGNPWSFYMQIQIHYIPAYFWSPYLSHITRSTGLNICQHFNLKRASEKHTVWNKRTKINK